MKLSCRLLLAFIALTAAALAADTYKVGDTFEGFSTKDQHDKPYTFSPGVRTVIVSFAMGTGKAANGFFEKQGANYLAQHQAVYLANIHGMPGFVRGFAMSSMRKYPHQILLADSEHLLDRYPMKKDHLTIFSLDPSGKIEGIRFIDPDKQMPMIFAAKP